MPCNLAHTHACTHAHIPFSMYKVSLYPCSHCPPAVKPEKLLRFALIGTGEKPVHWTYSVYNNINKLNNVNNS